MPLHWKIAPLEQMVVWDPDEIGGGHTPDSLAKELKKLGTPS